MYDCKKINTQQRTEDDDKEPEPVDFDWVELIAMQKLGHTKKEARHMYFGEFIDKFRLYKKLFNIEKQGMYATELEQAQQIASLRDL